MFSVFQGVQKEISDINGLTQCFLFITLSRCFSSEFILC